MGLKNHEIAYFNTKLSALPPWFETLVFMRTVHPARHTTHKSCPQIPHVLLCLHALKVGTNPVAHFVTFPGFFLEPEAEYRHDRNEKLNALDIMKPIKRIFQTFTLGEIPQATRPASLIDNVAIMGRDTGCLLPSQPLSPIHNTTKCETIFASVHIGHNFLEKPPSVKLENIAVSYTIPKGKVEHSITTQWVDLKDLFDRLVDAQEYGLNKFRIIPKSAKKLPPTVLIDGSYVHALQVYASVKAKPCIPEEWIVSDPRTRTIIPVPGVKKTASLKKINLRAPK